MQEQTHEKQRLTADLRQALARRQLEVYYQPIIDLPSGKIVKAEALLRWHHPEMGQISPEIFIPVAEDSGLLHQIGHWVFRQAISFIEQCRQRHNRLIQISVNKSPIQFEKDIYDDWPQYLSQTGLPGDSITVEITEGSLLSKSPKIKQRLLDYINFGIEVSIDDFGTGFSALSYLHQFDIDYLKIDRSFIMDLSEN
ncbi:MAG: EAL domain-containing protein, partial [Gammaproteobacteria bacterium]|nr:EAL domain-containing protein [Gammaproteobacteria bacterium]